MTTSEKVLERARMIPDQVLLQPSDSESLESFELTLLEKLFVAEKSFQWKQSVETTLARIISRGLRLLN
jgi:hypothetical protein